MQIMNRAQLKKLWNRSQTDRKFNRLLLVILAALAAAPSKSCDQLAACALADYTLKKAGPARRRELKRRLKSAGWDF
jgi:hypothetical protein